MFVESQKKNFTHRKKSYYGKTSKFDVQNYPNFGQVHRAGWAWDLLGPGKNGWPTNLLGDCKKIWVDAIIFERVIRMAAKPDFLRTLWHIHFMPFLALFGPILGTFYAVTRPFLGGFWIFLGRDRESRRGECDSGKKNVDLFHGFLMNLWLNFFFS